MMGHREKLKNGAEYDLSGMPGHRWRDLLANHKPGYWRYWKNRINRRSRRIVKVMIKDCQSKI